jgi:hypothetical protein
MELHEEYIARRKIKAPCIKYVDRANLILRSQVKDCEWAWLHVSISSNADQNHPNKYTFVVSANPTLYSTPDFNHFTQHAKVLKEQVWEWEQYESGLVEFAKEYAGKYVAITSQDAVFVAWQMFVTNYDAWIAHFLPFRLQESVYQSLVGERKNRFMAIKEIEDYIKEKFERVFICWRNIKSTIEQKNYADWLAKVVNDMAA